MPDAITRICSVMGCAQHLPCPDHTRTPRQRQAERDSVRKSRHERGYGTRWDKFRQWHMDECFRRMVPRAGLCGSRLPGAPLTTDSLCAQRGDVGPSALAKVLDHIVPVTGPHDPTFFGRYAHQWLCQRDHDLKRKRESQR